MLKAIALEAPALAEGSNACEEAGAFPALVAALTAHAEDAEVCQSACDTLAFITYSGTDKTFHRADAAVAADAPLVLAEVLRSHAGNPDVCALVCLELSNIAWGGADRRPQACVAVEGMAELLVSTLRRHEDNLSVAPFVVRALKNLCFSFTLTAASSARKDLFVREGAIGALVAVLQQHAASGDSRVSELFESACEALKVLSDSPARKEKCAVAIPTLVSTLKGRAADPGVVSYACGALFSIAHSSNPRRDATVAAGAIPLLRDALRDHAEDEAVCRQAARALSNLVWTNQAHRAAAIKEGVIPYLVAACTAPSTPFKRHNSAVGMAIASEALMKLGYNEKGDKLA